jgi:histidine ammonia-lyase
MCRFKTIAIIVFLLTICSITYSKTILLDGKSLTPDKIQSIADGTSIKVSEAAIKRVKKSFDILIKAAEEGHKIYGLTVGVGQNKDKQAIDTNGKLTEYAINASEKFNLSLLHAHCAALGGEMSIPLARAVMVVRLNNMLTGGSGVQPKVVEILTEFINKKITPVMYNTGSIGQADITILGHLGLAMIGEGDVYYKGEKITASKALKNANLSPITLFGKDALGIISSNSYSSALAALAIVNLEHLSQVYKLLYALSLEGLNGNVYPIMKETLAVRPFPAAVKAAKEIREYLKGSYLWEEDTNRPLQDPLSYRDIAYVAGCLSQAIDRVNELMLIQLNSSDDNPAILLNYKNKHDNFSEKNISVNMSGSTSAVAPSANFDPLLMSMDFEHVSLALAYCSSASSQRTIKLSDPNFTKLSRFLGTDKTVHAFGAIQKPFVALNAVNQHLANPIILNFQSVAGNIEDMATNAPLIIEKINMQIDNMYGILAFELLHSAQAIDLRKQENPNLKLSYSTEKIFNGYRKKVNFMDQDRVHTNDIKESISFLKNLDVNSLN